MSRKRREAIEAAAVSTEVTEPTVLDPSRIKRLFTYLKTHLWVTAIIAVVFIGASGAGLKYLEEDAKRELAKNSMERSIVSSINPFLPPPTPVPTPPLSKEYLYAGSRLLAVEDANASAVPPADLAVWRPSSGYWYVKGGPGSTETYYPWGNSSDLPAPGDYDGDGKTDFAVFRASAGQSYIVKSSDNTWYAVTLGTTDDKPVPGDYDGDDKTDTALYRPSNSTWHIIKSSDSSGYNFTWGTSGDKTAPADYDGDGKTDAAIWRGNELNFYVLQSSDGNLASAHLATAASGDTPVPADYDGDTIADIAVLNGNNWIIKSSSTGNSATITWHSGDTPVPNDYDADGLTDIAVWRDSNGGWYIRQSSKIGTQDELRNVIWGMAGDFPVPAFYRR